jgi:hypothetical protein
VRSYFPAQSRGSSAPDGFGLLKWWPNPLALAVFIGFAVILSTRQLYIAPDDIPYIDYFSNNAYWLDLLTTENRNWWLAIIEEPLWNTYATALGAEIGPETAFRLTIFSSTLLYLFFSSKLSGGNWGTATFLFALHPHLAVQMYYNQIRQGVGLSIFLALVCILRLRTPARIAVASGVAALVHSAFIPIFALTASYLVNQRTRVLAAIIGAVFLAAAAQYIDLYSLIDTGRRESHYAASVAVNVNFYIVQLPTYSLIFYVLWPKAGELRSSEWYFLSFLAAAAGIAATSIHEAGGRIVYIAEAATTILVARNVKSQNGLIALGVWVLSIAISIISDYKYDTSEQARVFEKWHMIIFGAN